MVGKVKTFDRRLLRRQCVSCGYDGSLLHGGRVDYCPRCSCDLQERPARSYAEMEGLVGLPLTIDAPLVRHRNEARLIHRWLAFLFCAMLGILAILYLTAAAFAV